MKVLKRVFDIVSAGTLLLFVSPLLIIVAVAEKLTGQDVFFQQDRVGIGLQPFGVLKFTSMPKGSEKLGMLAAADDKRPTKLGRFLRKTKINEIPQLFNVLRGDMSVVGPRPLFAKQVAKYDEHVQQAIATVRPGVTGLGSLFFSAEDELLASVPEKDRFYDEVVQPQKGRIEVYYCENWSMGLDLQIVMLTALAVLTGRRLFPRKLESLVDGFDAEVERFRQTHCESHN
jgi:lipopolysaccharide/colanic/teichoic acid biosynthesis glycosyltransferase